ncbi:MAG: hypothetical protein DRH12_12845 [Deltaproteobacteria bacterium]|nr:MAG: hypothetical protein DRH12_12845 [Deltaproteobacteria bacterium]
MSYLEWRIKHKVQINFIAWFLVSTSVLFLFVTPYIFYFILGMLILLEFIEDIFVKCPECGKRPGGWLFQIDKKCRRCGASLLDEAKDSDIEHP